MKRSTLTTILAFVLVISTASQASACLCIPYIPFLDPFAWLGFYGCGGGGGGGGCGYGGGGGFANGYGAGYRYAPQQQSYGYGGFAPRSMAYPVAPASPGCSSCTGALPVPQQQALTAVRVPVTTYRAVTQYVPQTTYQTQYRAATRQSVAYQPQTYGYQSAYGYQPVQSAYVTPTYGQMASPATAYNGVIPAQTAFAQPAYPSPAYPSQAQTTPSYQTPYYAPSTFQPPVIASPGDVGGDHEWSAQSAQIPIIPNSHIGRVPARPISYGVAPRSARTFSATVK